MSDEKIKAPDRIFLHPDDDDGGIEGASWFEGRLSAEDIEYTRSDLVEALRERVKELESARLNWIELCMDAINQAQQHSYERKICTVTHDFISTWEEITGALESAGFASHLSGDEYWIDFEKIQAERKKLTEEGKATP